MKWYTPLLMIAAVVGAIATFEIKYDTPTAEREADIRAEGDAALARIAQAQHDWVARRMALLDEQVKDAERESAHAWQDVYFYAGAAVGLHHPSSALLGKFRTRFRALLESHPSAEQCTAELSAMVDEADREDSGSAPVPGDAYLNESYELHTSINPVDARNF